MGTASCIMVQTNTASFYSYVHIHITQYLIHVLISIHTNFVIGKDYVMLEVRAHGVYHQ
jgi:hypothetical protein